MRHQRCRTRVWCGRTQQRAGDAAARASSRVPLLRATWIPRDFHRLVPTRLRLGPKSGRFRPKFKKKKRKKKVQNAPFDLILNPTLAQFHWNAKTPLLTFRLTSLSSLCLYALCLSASVSSPLLLQFCICLYNVKKYA